MQTTMNINKNIKYCLYSEDRIIAKITKIARPDSMQINLYPKLFISKLIYDISLP